MRGPRGERCLIVREVERWPGASVRFERGSKHVRARLSYKDRERFVVMAATGSDRRGVLNAVRDVRRELRTLGAERINRHEQ